MGKRDKATLQRLMTDLGNVRLSDALAAISMNAKPGAPKKWSDEHCWILYMAIEDQKDRGLKTRAACRRIAVGTVHSPNEIEAVYYRTDKRLGHLVRPYLPDLLRDWRAS
jgi:hypothetical protein